MGQNVVQKILSDVEVAEAKLMNLGEKVALVLKREKALEPNFIGGVRALVVDATALVSEGEAVATAEGLNFAVDGAAYVAFQKFVADLKLFAPVVEAAISNLK